MGEIHHKQDRSVEAQRERNTGKAAKAWHRKVRAEARQEKRDERTPKQQLNLIKKRRGNSIKEARRLKKLVKS